jgi:two-component system, cell cycle sensor histidine kinase and response regulator CckA
MSPVVDTSSAGDVSVPNLFDKRRGGDRRVDQQARFELALDASGVGMWDWDLANDVLSWDERTCAIFGVPPQAAMTYARYLSLLDPADRDDTHRLVAEALDPRGHGYFATEYRVIRPNGDRSIIASRGRALFSDDGHERRAIRLVGTVLDVTERKRMDTEREVALAALRSSEQRYALAARATDTVIWDWDLLSERLLWSDGVERVFGYQQDYVPDQSSWWFERIHPDDRMRVTEGIHRIIHGARDDNSWHDQYRFRRANGQYATVVDRGYVTRDLTGRAVRMIGAMEDETEREQLQERLRQAQKMEAVGQLAGGIAHDFNNLLTVITGNLEFAVADLPVGHRVREDLDEIARATDRARELVRQLLAFSRKQAVVLQQVDLSEVVGAAESLLRRVIGEEIVLDVHLAAELPLIKADRGQLEQVLMNLAVNARDAMLTPAHGTRGRGGTLQIETAHVELTSDELLSIPELSSGRAVRLRVRDSGHGMDEATRERAFEPFFTTKHIGQGTGLGLATVFGIVKLFGGAITVHSIPGTGTMFCLYFPIAEGAVATATPPPSTGEEGPAGGTILLVEDESAVRSAARRMLERRGYTVIEARHGADALLVWRDRRVLIDAVVTDLRMPELGGRELVQLLRGEQPDLPVVYMSGYSEQSVPDANAPRTAFVEKPFTMDRLLGAVERVMAPVGVS